MRTFRWLVVMCTIAFVASCGSQQPPAAPQGPEPVGTLRDVMHMIVESQAQVIFDSVAVRVTQAGVEEKEPRTEEEWDVVLHSAMNLAEAANLLTTAGRRISRPEDANTAAGEGELTPVQIQTKIDANRDLWLKHVKELQTVAMQAYKAASDKNVQALWDIGEPIDQACESCHLQFWYPEGGPPPAPAQ